MDRFLEYWSDIDVTGPAKKDQVGTKYTISENHKYLTFCVQHLLFVSYKMLPIKLFVDDKNFISMALADH